MISRKQEQHTGIGSTGYQGDKVLELMTFARNYNASLLRDVLRHAGNATGAVDFGAGIGTFAMLARDAGLAVTCIEPDATRISVLRKNLLVAFSDIQALPADSVPYVYTLNVLEHIEEDARALRDIFDTLCPGGRCFLYVPAFQVLYSAFDRRIGHVRRYRRRPLVALFENQGFFVEKALYRDSLGFFVALLFRFLSNKDGDVSRTAIMLYDRLLFPVSRVLDHLLGTICGKNVMIVARKPSK